MNLKALLAAFSLLICSFTTLDAQNTEAKKISTGTYAFNFGLVYVAQWAFYYVSQKQTIEERGSFTNWYSNMHRVHLDKDNFDFNIILHTIAGTYYNLWYRSRGYSRPAAVFWSILSSAVFEFTIETITEPPSWQDLYQTPILGAVVGLCLDEVSVYFLRKRHWGFKTIAYLINPLRIIPGSMMLATSKSAQVKAEYRF